MNCGLPPSISNGSSGTPTYTTFGGSVVYSCDDGYTISSLALVICSSNGMWETLPTCTGERNYVILLFVNYKFPYGLNVHFRLKSVHAEYTGERD